MAGGHDRIWSTASAASAPRSSSCADLGPGEIGFITAQIKEVAQTRVGDTITDAKRPAAEALPGFKEVQPVVFCGLFPVDAADFEKLRESISKLRLNDASLQLRDGDQRRAGLRLPLRLPRAAPPRDHPGAADPRIRPRPDHHRAVSVVYKIELTARRQGHIELHNPADMPDPNRIESIEEPWIEATIYVPDEYLGSDPEAVPGPPRHPEGPDLRRRPRAGDLRTAAQRSGVRLLRPAEVASAAAMPASTITRSATARATSSR